jgi:hypothetical protein
MAVAIDSAEIAGCAVAGVDDILLVLAIVFLSPGYRRGFNLLVRLLAL